MQISIHADVLERYPDFLMGIVELSIARYDKECLQKAIIAANKDMQIPLRNTAVEEKWTQVFLDMNASAKRLPSVISLWNVQERFGELRSINYFVDAYNHISTKHGIPMGGYDITNLPANDITLRYGKRGDKFQPLGLNQVEKIKDESEVVYYSGDDVICRYWNNKDSEITKITENTTKLVIILDYFGELERLTKAMDELEALIGCTSDLLSCSKHILSVTQPSLSTEVNS